MLLPKKHLYLVAALIWGVPGITITLKGIDAYSDVQPQQIWWLLIVTACVTVFFFLIFRRVTKRYIKHISTQPDRCQIYCTFPINGWATILFMMGLGIALKFTPSIPLQFTASFYSGLGSMLIVAAFRFLIAPTKSRR